MDEKKVILMTGCAGGIGGYLAERLSREGHHLAVTDVDEKRLQEIARDRGWSSERVHVQGLDVRRKEEWERVIRAVLDRWSRIDVLMNIAGVIRPGYIHETDLEMIDYHIDINLKGTIIGTKLAAEQMVRQGWGHIINIASLAGVTPVCGLDLYSTSKFGVRGFTLSIAPELKRHNIDVTVVCPDLVDTHMLTLQLDYPEAALSFSGGRHLTVEEIGEVILDQGVRKRRLEILHPSSRGLLAKVSSFQPRLIGLLYRRLARKGRKRQEALKRS